jgi:hypothetical protein
VIDPVERLLAIAAKYEAAGDRGRAHAFSHGARLLTGKEISPATIRGLTGRGMGPSILEEVQLALAGLPSPRLVEVAPSCFPVCPVDHGIPSSATDGINIESILAMAIERKMTEVTLMEHAPGFNPGMEIAAFYRHANVWMMLAAKHGITGEAVYDIEVLPDGRLSCEPPPGPWQASLRLMPRVNTEARLRLALGRGAKRLYGALPELATLGHLAPAMRLQHASWVLSPKHPGTPELQAALRAAGIDVLLASDAHQADQITFLDAMYSSMVTLEG